MVYKPEGRFVYIVEYEVGLRAKAQNLFEDKIKEYEKALLSSDGRDSKEDLDTMMLSTMMSNMRSNLIENKIKG